MIDHVSLPVSDVARAKAFYDAVLAPLGWRRTYDFDEGGDTIFSYGPDDDTPVLWLSGPKRGHHKVASLAGLHVAFAAAQRPQVDAFYQAALANGGRDNGPPGLRPQYHASYYAAFVLDPDGHHLETVCQKPEGSD